MATRLGKTYVFERGGFSTKAAFDHPAAACPRGTKDCVTCHMLKYEVPGTHTKFTDHFIGIARSGAYYPR